MAIVKAQPRLCSLCLGIVVAGLMLVAPVQFVSARTAASAYGSAPTLSDNRNMGDVQLPRGMDPMEVVRIVHRNRERMREKQFTGELSPYSLSPGHRGVGFESEYMGKNSGQSDPWRLDVRSESDWSRVLRTSGEHESEAPSASTSDIGSGFQIGGDPLYGPAGNSQYVPAVAFSGTNYLVVWHDCRSGSLDIYGARVSVGGTVLDTAGIAISTAVDDQVWAGVAFDGTNFFVVWHDFRNGSSTDIYGARVSVGGAVFDPEGIAISTAANDQYSATVAFDGTNYLVVWSDLRSGSSYDIYGARVSVEGAVLDPAGIAISIAGGNQTRPEPVFDGVGYLVVWQDERSGPADIYGARVSVGGNVLDPTGIPISTAANDQSSPDVALDGTNCLVVWSDMRGGANADIYGTRVNVEGSVLDTAGIPISTATNNQSTPDIAFDGKNYLVVWGDNRNDNYYYDVYGARVTAGGTVLDPSGIVISNAANTQGQPAVAFDGTNYLVVWYDNRSAGYSDVYGARVSLGGSALDTAGIAMSSAANDQYFPAIAFDGTNYLVVWTDYRSRCFYNGDIYGARVSANGSVIDESGIAISTAAYDQLHPAVVLNGTDYLVVWEDWRSRSNDIYGARVSPGGTVLDTAGIAISTAVDDQSYPAIAFDGTNCLVVWHDLRSGGSYDIYGARVSPGGTVLDTAGIAISTAASDQCLPAIAFDGMNYLVVWQDYRSGSSYDIYGARVSAGGSVLDASGIAISTAAYYQGYPAIASDGTNYLVVWQDYRSGSSYDIYGARVSEGGSVLDLGGIAISSAANTQEMPAIGFDGTNYLVVWEDNRSGNYYYDIYGARVSVGGSVLDPTGMAISTASGNQEYPTIARGPANCLLIAYDSFTLPPYGAFRIWGNFAGQLTAVLLPTPACGRYGLYQNYPNPFNPVCTIRYDIPKAVKTSLRVFDVNGSIARTLADAWKEPGVYSEVWDGRRDDGTALPSGVYFYQLKADDFVATRKMVLIH